MDDTMQSLETSDKDINEVLGMIAKSFEENDLALTTDYAHEMTVLSTQIDTASQNAKEAAVKAKELRNLLTQAQTDYTEACAQLKVQSEKNETNRIECAQRLEKLAKAVKRLQNKTDALNEDERIKKREATSLENQLAGVIQCPKCKHEFTLNAQLDIIEARKSLKAVKDAIVQIGKDIIANNKEYEKTIADGKNQREIETTLDNERRKIQQDSDAAVYY